MTEFRFSDEDYDKVNRELEEIELRKRTEEAKRISERNKTIRLFENLFSGINSSGGEEDPGNDNDNNNNSYGNANNNDRDGDDTPLDLADELIKRYNLKTISTTKEIYYFDAAKGVYLPNGDILIESELESSYVQELQYHGGGQKWTNRAIAEIIGQVQRRTYIDISALNAQKEWLACADCMLNLMTGETAPFDPKYLNTTQIPVKYHLAADNRRQVADFWYYCVQDPIIDSCPCPGIMKFLNEVMAPEDVEIVLDFIAYCLWREYKFHKWILFNGAGQNGKSTFLTVIGRFLGPANVAGESLDRLLGE
jgi:hypothetical protein